MRRSFGAVGILAAAAALSLLAGAAGARMATPARHRSGTGRVIASPSSGYPGTFFHIHFRAPDQAGKVGGQERYYVVSATGPSSGGNCANQASAVDDSSQAHTPAKVTLKPGSAGWCVGTFHGTVTEQARPICPYREVCPQYVILIRRIGKFSFTIDAQPPGGDTTPPTFAGLVSAEACTPGPQRPGETTPYHLSWRAAHDDVTPSSQIVYDVFMSKTAGGEDYYQPTWTTAPGVTKFQTPGLPAHGTVYFVVRARDQAGNEDTNEIERQGVDPCL